MIPTYRKVMVTTDFSTVGNRAIPHAYGVLPKDGGTVILWHVVEVPELPNPLYAHYSAVRVLSPAERQALRETVLRSLEALVPAEVRGQPMISTELRVVETPGAVHEVICQEAGALNVDLLVMASHGHSGMARLFLGSVAERVLRSADRPVLIVRGA